MADEQQIERVDPAPRSVSGAYMGRVTNPDPERVYLLANPNDDSFGALASEADGWQYLVAKPTDGSTWSPARTPKKR